MEKPILFSGEMVQAILDGRKTQTRRVIKPQPVSFSTEMMLGDGDKNSIYWRCPYGQPGDRLWVRETWAATGHDLVTYRADNTTTCVEEWWEIAKLWEKYGSVWRPSIFMPRWASRITLEIVNVRIERVQDISEHDAQSEGIEIEIRDMAGYARDYSKRRAWFQDWGDCANANYETYVPSDEIFRASYRTLWDKINAKRGFGWDVNPWVWVVEFKRLEN